MAQISPLLWLWQRLAAIAPIQPLAWEFPYPAGAALKTKRKEKKKTQYKRLSVASAFSAATTGAETDIDTISL